MNSNPLISVIIPCYNHGSQLQRAIDSVLYQSYSNLEIIVVDDGSTDNTREVAQHNKSVKYVYQGNQGLSSARNKGISSSSGELLIFLDADDYLYEEACAINLDYMIRYEKIALVSGSHDKVYTNKSEVQPVVKTVPSDHYTHLLRGNYIGMHAAVMYRKWVFDEFLYDTTLKACEDYDLYLRVARKYPVLHHANRIAAYVLHDSNMSNNTNLMINSALKVLKRQKQQLLSKYEASAYAEGKEAWKAYYYQELSEKLQKRSKLTLQEYYILLRYNPGRTFSNYKAVVQNIMVQYAPYDKLRKRLIYMFQQRDFIPLGKVNLGDLNRTSPFSTQFGYDRGGPVDRCYIESFLGQEAPSIKGRVLEIGDNTYTMLYGGDKITKSDILHVDGTNPNATFVGDISNAPDLPNDTFDCIILTQTLHLIYHFKDALHTCHRILKPGGTLLLTVPGITPIDHGEWKDTWYWSFTDKAMKRLMEETFPSGKIAVYPFGNVLTATAFLYGLGLQEVPKEKLWYNDPHYQVIITVKATKV